MRLLTGSRIVPARPGYPAIRIEEEEEVAPALKWSGRVKVGPPGSRQSVATCFFDLFFSRLPTNIICERAHRSAVDKRKKRKTNSFKIFSHLTLEFLVDVSGTNFTENWKRNKSRWIVYQSVSPSADPNPSDFVHMDVYFSSLVSLLCVHYNRAGVCLLVHRLLVQRRVTAATKRQPWFLFLFFSFFVSLQQPSIKANDKEPLGLDLLKERRNNGVAERISHILVWGFGALLAPADWTLDLAVRDSFAGEKKRRERGWRWHPSPSHFIKQ